MDRFVIAWAIDLQWFQLDISGVKIKKVGGSRARPVVLLVPFLDQSRTTASNNIVQPTTPFSPFPYNRIRVFDRDKISFQSSLFTL